MSKIKHRQAVRIRGLHEIVSKQLKADKNGFKVSPSAATGVTPAILQPTVSTHSRFKPVEHRHNDTTRVIVEKLQSFLPNMIQNGSCADVNLVLEKTLEYLRSIRTDNHDTPRPKQLDKSDHHSTTNTMNPSIPRILRHRPLPVTQCKYLFSFDNAPFGIVICQIDGAFITSNRYFRKLDHGMQIIQSIFSVVSSESVNTMKVPESACNEQRGTRRT
jgi:hypothetical protein